MTNLKVLEFYKNLSALRGLTGVKLNYAIIKNISKLEIEVKSFEKALEASEGFSNYEKERIALAEKHSKKNEDGTPVFEIVNEQQQYVLEDKEAFDIEFKALKEANEGVINDRIKQLKDFDTISKEENSVEIHKIDLSDVPEDITTEQLLAIYPMIKE